MSGLFGFVVGGLAERLIPVLQTPVEDIIYEVLDQKGLPTRSEVRELRNKLERLEKTLGDLKDSMDSLAGEVGNAAAAAESARELAASRSAAPAARSKVVPIKPLAVASSSRTCKVPECESDVRAKGLCGKHYQRFKRGTLDGFVGVNGLTIADNVQYRVGEDFAGQVVVTRYEGDEVLFLLPELGGQEVRGKVNDLRID